ncbi:hypothetical protein RB597_006975 [Gaeumannomyces tritici]
MADTAGFEAFAFRSADEILAENSLNTSDVFRSFPVDSNAGEIRLLKLEDGEWDDPIRIDFQVAGSLEQSSDALRYNAVSYAWGVDDVSGEMWRYRISLCGRPLLITWNLFSVLRRLRVYNKHVLGRDAGGEGAAPSPQLLWVDAVCINQADAEERGRQVRMMGRIYSGCAEVLVFLDEWQRQSVAKHDAGPDSARWFRGDAADFGPLWDGYRSMFDSTATDGQLGAPGGEASAPGEPGGLAAVTTTTSYAGSITIAHLSFLLAWAVRLLAEGRHISEIAPFRPDMEAGGAETRDLIDGLTDFAARVGSARWFGRLWVVQEGVLGPAVRVLFGTASLPLDTIAAARAARRAHAGCWRCHDEAGGVGAKLLQTAVQRFLDSINDVAGLRRERGRKRPLLELCLRFMYRDSGLDHDRVFALLGLAAESFEPDYGEELADVYTRVCRSHILEHRSLTCLSFAEFRYRCRYNDFPKACNAHGSFIPSWAVDFSAISVEKINGNYLVWYQRLPNFNACRGLAPLAADVDDDNTLLLQGIEFDRVARLATKRRPVWPRTYDALFGDWDWEADSSEVSDDEAGDETAWADTASLGEYQSSIFDEAKADMFYHWRNLVRSRARDPQSDAYVGGGTWADAWWRTLCLDHGWGPGRLLQRASEDDIRVLSTSIEREEACMSFKTLQEVQESRSAAGPGLSFEDFLHSLETGNFNTDTRTMDMVNAISPGLMGRKLFLTERGYLGLGASNLWVGDSVFILPGARVPVILRRMVDEEGPVSTEYGPAYKLVGDGYVHGIMDGEAVTAAGSAVVSLLLA